jgi:hypothetical protein
MTVTKGSLTMAANSLIAGNLFRLSFGGALSYTSTSATVTIGIYLGGNLLASGATSSLGSVTVANLNWGSNYGGHQFMLLTTGASAKLLPFITSSFSVASSPGGQASGALLPTGLTSQLIDTTSALAWDLRVTLGGGFSATSFVCQYFMIEML